MVDQTAVPGDTGGQATAIMEIEKAHEQLKGLDFGVERGKPRDLEVGFIEDAPTIKVGDRHLLFANRAAKTSLKTQTGLDPDYLLKMKSDPDLVSRVAQHVLGQGPNDTLRFVRHGAELVDVQTSGHPWFAPVEVLEQGVKTLGDRAIGVHKMDFVKSKMSMRIITNKHAEPPKKNGDISHTGVWLQSNGWVETAAYVHRMVCVNGMMMSHNWIDAGKTRDDLAGNFEREIELAYKNSCTLLDNFMELDNHPEANPTAAIMGLGRAAQISDRNIRRILENVPEMGDGATRYDLVNVVTATSHDYDDISYQWAGGHLVGFYQDHHCSHCGGNL